MLWPNLVWKLVWVVLDTIIRALSFETWGGLGAESRAWQFFLRVKKSRSTNQWSISENARHHPHLARVMLKKNEIPQERYQIPGALPVILTIAVQQKGLVKRQRILSRHCNGHLSPIQNVPPFKMHPTTFVSFWEIQLNFAYYYISTQLVIRQNWN